MLNTHCMDNQEIIDVGGIICLKNEFDSQLGRGGVGVQHIRSIMFLKLQMFRNTQDQN